MQKARYLLVLLVCLSLLAAVGVQAQNGNGLNLLFSLALDEPVQCAAPGETILFSGTITNLFGQNLHWNSFTATVAGPYASVSFAPGFLSFLSGSGGQFPIAGYTGSLFNVAWASNAPVGHEETGTFSGDMETASGTYREQHSVGYTARVCDQNPVPEPSSLLALMSGLPLAGFLLRRKRS